MPAYPEIKRLKGFSTKNPVIRVSCLVKNLKGRAAGAAGSRWTAAISSNDWPVVQVPHAAGLAERLGGGTVEWTNKRTGKTM